MTRLRLSMGVRRLSWPYDHRPGAFSRPVQPEGDHPMIEVAGTMRVGLLMNHEQRGPINACAGDTIELSAPGEGVGGYSWRAEVPAAVGRVVAEGLGHPKSGVGSGRDKIFSVRIERTGDAVVRLVQSRPWDSSEGRVIEVPIHCSAAGADAD